MTILDSELQCFKSAVVNDTTANGGRLSATRVISGVVQNVWPHVLKAERDAGSTKYRKLFFKVSNDADETLLSAQLFLDGPTAAGDYVTMFAATQRNTRADITGAERKYGAALLQADAGAGSSTLVLEVEHADLAGMFLDGDTVRVTNKATPTSGTGTEELVTVSGEPVVAGTQVTLTLAAPLANAYSTASGSRAASVYNVGDVLCTFDNWVETTAAGTYDETVYPPILDNIGTVEQTWTLTFSDATNFTVAGDTVGSVGAGNISTNFTPNNPDWSKPYFTLDAAGFGGTWANGNTIVFQTHPAAVPVWEKRVVPAGTATMANNRVTAVFMGESA